MNWSCTKERCMHTLYLLGVHIMHSFSVFHRLLLFLLTNVSTLKISKWPEYLSNVLSYLFPRISFSLPFEWSSLWPHNSQIQGRHQA